MQKNIVNVFTINFFVVMLLIISGCSSYQASRPQARTTLPEVTRPTVRRNQVQVKKHQQSVVKQSQPKRSTASIKPRVKAPIAKVQRYNTTPKTSVITQREVQAVLKQKQTAVEVKSEATPYDNIPNSSSNTVSRQESSPAVKSLVIRARADMAIGLDQSAVSKLERALRIEPSNPDLWYLLAKAQQSTNNHQQAISMAKKAISLAGADESIAVKSWKLIKKSGEASGDSMVVKEAINYSNVNP